MLLFGCQCVLDGRQVLAYCPMSKEPTFNIYKGFAIVCQAKNVGLITSSVHFILLIVSDIQYVQYLLNLCKCQHIKACMKLQWCVRKAQNVSTASSCPLSLLAVQVSVNSVSLSTGHQSHIVTSPRLPANKHPPPTHISSPIHNPVGINSALQEYTATHSQQQNN